MTRDEAVARIHASYRPGKKSGHQRMRRLLELLGDPHRQLKFVHIAGTNGKGSCAAMSANVLKTAGYKVGLNVSPFVIEFTETIATQKLYEKDSAEGGWPASYMRKYLNGYYDDKGNFIEGEIYKSLPDDLKKVIINTYVVSDHAKDDKSGNRADGNFESALS